MQQQGNPHSVNVEMEEIPLPQSSSLERMREEEEEEKENIPKKEKRAGRSRAEKATEKETVKTKAQSVPVSPAKIQMPVTSKILPSSPLKTLTQPRTILLLQALLFPTPQRPVLPTRDLPTRRNTLVGKVMSTGKR